MRIAVSAGYEATVPKVISGLALTTILGRGSSGVVFRAVHMETEQTYAVKVMAKQFLIDHNAVNRFKREVTILSSLDSPHVVKFYDCLDDDELVYLVTEFCELGTMEAVLLRPEGCAEHNAVHFVRQLVEGVHYLHARGIAHRDLKPQNIMVDAQFNLKLCDFGFAIEISAGLQTARCGSPMFSAPEVISSQPYDPQCADMWSLGVIVFWLVTGTIPWKDVTHQKALVYDIQTAKYHIPEHLSPNFANFVGGLMQPQPMLRFTPNQALAHPWLQMRVPNATGSYGGPALPHVTSTGPPRSDSTLEKIIGVKKRVARRILPDAARPRFARPTIKPETVQEDD
jgi:serine/threonine protein kinase